MLYQEDQNEGSIRERGMEFLAQRLKQQEQIIDFARRLMNGVMRNRDELDEKINELATWNISQLALTDLNAMRIGAFEILYLNTPPRVAINESVEMAKRFGGKNSGQFVNGVLDRLHKQYQEEKA